ncbi:hypothetical protein JL100_004185 [Skermanella mucosa]|uniref:hypothetical protein n=1 Tax=Skermanella mucosa TaxID=1789672 RepID=UPI00192BDD5D|nr:hypothetical protein [Skermanella mucosa]UEM21971.1 hypothetical protein JL100_004185 [Skermanella mucosa]
MAHANKAAKTKPISYRAQAAAQAGRGLWSGFLMGLGAIPTLYSVDFSPPRYRSAGVAGDWQAVGTDIRNAMRGHEERS